MQAQALEARDLNGDGSADAYYDSALNVSWLARTDLIGATTLTAAASWASGLEVHGVTGWRLPTATYTAPGCASFGCYMPSVSTSELSSLYVRVGTHGPFADLQTNRGYWIGNLDPRLSAFDVPYGHYFSFGYGGDGATDEWAVGLGFAWAVHDGDVAVAAVPEPSTYALVLAGLTFVAWRARRSSAPTRRSAGR